MQTLGVWESTAPSDSRLKNIFWPTIRSRVDVDTLGSQGFWICVAIGVVSLASNFLIGQPIAGVFLFIYFYLGGVGVREQSCYAAVAVFAMYVATFAISPGILSFFCSVLLLSVLRATFIASFWERNEGATEMPVRFNETWKDIFADQWPAKMWPKIRIAYYIYSAGFLFLFTLGLTMVLFERRGLIPMRLLH
jgi:hypothetical protein